MTDWDPPAPQGPGPQGQPPPLEHAPPGQPAASPAAPATYGSPAYSPDGLPAGVEYASPWLRLGAYFVESILVIVTLFIGWIIWALVVGGDGQTPAKKLLGLRVVRADHGRPASLGRMFWMRGLVAGWASGFVILFTLGIILFMPFWDRRNQNIWDKISGCYVVTDPHDAYGTALR